MNTRAAFTTGLLLIGSVAFAQYWPGTPWPDPYYVNPYYADPMAMPWTDMMQQLEQQTAMLNEQVEAELQRINQLFINFYRQETGDYTSPDSVALSRGKDLHCQRDPLDCQLAAQGSQRAMQDQQASFAAHQAIMQERNAANDAAFNSWMQQQEGQYAAGQDFIQSTIYEEGNYTNPSSGTTYSLPFAPSVQGMYQTPDGYPLVFDAAGNTWYQLDGNGGYTPYYGQ